MTLLTLAVGDRTSFERKSYAQNSSIIHSCWLRDGLLRVLKASYGPMLDRVGATPESMDRALPMEKVVRLRLIEVVPYLAWHNRSYGQCLQVLSSHKIAAQQACLYVALWS